MTATAFHELASLLSERMINGMATGVVLTLLAWAFLRIAGRQNSNTRFAVWFAALVAIAALPFAGNLAPYKVPLDEAAAGSSTISLPASWAVGLVLAWAAVGMAGLLRLAIGLIRLRQVRKNAVALEVSRLDPVLRETLQSFPSRRNVALGISDRQRVPAVLGFFRPLIVFPSWTMRELSTPELNSILIHELAHLRRWDDWTNLVQKVVRALLFFHPAVWWIESRISLEREMACDDIVLSRTANARAYAECLVSIAERSFLQRTLALTQAAVSRMRQTSCRVAQILDGSRPGATRVSKPALFLMATLVLICGVTQSRAPQLVAFRDSQASVPVLAASVSHQPSVQLASFKHSILEPLPREIGTAPVARFAHARRSARPPATEAKLDGLPSSAIHNVALTGNPRVAETMLVVFHQQQYGQLGQVQWTVLVWQVRVQGTVETQPPPKKI
jgi:beta-lactamase regulating signal transducer with metallopeptidase domain